jgi:hypothetical protein
VIIAAAVAIAMARADVVNIAVAAVFTAQRNLNGDFFI